MPSSRSISLRLPRERRKLSSRLICSRSRRPKRPTPNSPSRAVPQLRQCRRVTVSSPAQTGQVAMTSWTIGSAAAQRSTGAPVGGQLVDPLRCVAQDRAARTGLIINAHLRIEEAVVDHWCWLLPECDLGLHFLVAMAAL